MCIISFFSHQNINASLKRFLMRWCLLQHPSNKTSLKINIYCRLAINNSLIPFLTFVKVIYHASTRCGIILMGRFSIIAANECKFHYIGKLLAESYTRTYKYSKINKCRHKNYISPLLNLGICTDNRIIPK